MNQNFKEKSKTDFNFYEGKDHMCLVDDWNPCTKRIASAP